MFRHSMFNRFGLMLAMVAALALAFTACGDDEESTSSETDTEPVAEIADLTGEDTSVALDAGFLDALTSLNVTPGTVGDATLKGTDISFPITGGNVTYYDPTSDVRPYVQGIINHEGSGLSLEAGGTTVELTDFVVDPGTSQLTGTVTANGKEAATDAVLFDLDGSTLENPPSESPSGGTVLTGTTVLLNQGAADLLNETFGIKDLAGGLEIGISTITVAG